MTKSAIRSLRVQASQSTDLSFNMPGVIAWQNYDHSNDNGPAFLGQRVGRYDLEQDVYPHLGKPDSSDDGLLFYGSVNLRELLRQHSLFMLRNEALGASLDQLLQQRRAAFRDRFKHRDAIQNLMQQFVPQMIQHLEEMRKSGAQRFSELDTAYGAGGVVKSTITRTTAPATTSRTQVHPVSTITSEINSSNQPTTTPINTEVYDMNASGKHVQRQGTPRTLGVPATLQGSAWQPATGLFETQVVESAPAGPQDMVSELQSYAHPKLENVFGYNQAMVALIPELLRQQTTALKLSDIAEIMASELAAMDLEIRNLQLNFVHTHLTSPLDGVVTGVFKDVGESSEPGEPVLRVENDLKILLVGRVQHQNPLWIDRTARITLASVFEDGSTRALEGPIVAIRGHEADNDEWEVIVRCNNPILSSGRPLLPLGYSFDPDTDTFETI